MTRSLTAPLNDLWARDTLPAFVEDGGLVGEGGVVDLPQPDPEKITGRGDAFVCATHDQPAEA